MTMSKADKIRAEAEAKAAMADLEDAILAALPQTDAQGEPFPWRVFCHGKAQRWARVEAADERCYGPDPYAPTLADLVTLGAELEPVPLALYQGRGCTSIQPAELEPPRGYERDDAQRIEPFILEAEGATAYGRRETLSIRIWARVAGELVRVSVILHPPYSGELGKVEQERADGRRAHQREGDIESARYHLPPGLQDGICVAEPEPDDGGRRRALALPQVISWYRGEGGGGRFTVYLSPLGEGGATLADLARELEGGER